MEKHVKAFWDHVKTFKGTADIGDVFLKWAADTNLTLNDAKEIWKQVNNDIYTIFNKKADISISGPKEEIEGLLKTKETANIESEIKPSENLSVLNEELDKTKQPNIEQPKNILSTLEDEEEESIVSPTEINEAIPTEVPELTQEPSIP